jgi:hypothetical protein
VETIQTVDGKNENTAQVAVFRLTILLLLSPINEVVDHLDRCGWVSNSGYTWSNVNRMGVETKWLAIILV